MAAKRDYKKEYAKFQSSPAEIKRRGIRNKDRKAAVKAGKASKPKKGNQGNPKKVDELDHSKGKAKGVKRVISAIKNRGKKGEGGRKKGVKKNQPKRKKSTKKK